MSPITRINRKLLKFWIDRRRPPGKTTAMDNDLDSWKCRKLAFKQYKVYLSTTQNVWKMTQSEGNMPSSFVSTFMSLAWAWHKHELVFSFFLSICKGLYIYSAGRRCAINWDPGSRGKCLKILKLRNILGDSPQNIIQSLIFHSTLTFNLQ